LNVVEAQFLGDFANGHLGLHQQLRDFVRAHTADFFQDGITQLAAEPHFK
jgi:hypothetical protein